MLIICPECHQKISDLSTQCIHCGCPIEKDELNTFVVNGIKYNFTEIFSKIDDSNITPALCVREISDLCNIPIFEAKEIYFKIKNGDMTQIINCESKQTSDVPKCPTCQSTNVQKISGGERVASVVALGIFSKKINKSFKCKSCGYTW